jgi:RuvB-like protein 1 (pontin 52)
VFVSNLKFRII